MATIEDSFTQGLCIYLNSFAHPRAFYYGGGGEEVQIRHVKVIAHNQLLATTTAGERLVITTTPANGG